MSHISSNSHIVTQSKACRTFSTTNTRHQRDSGPHTFWMEHVIGEGDHTNHTTPQTSHTSYLIMADKTCYNCGEVGHLSRDCAMPKAAYPACDL